MIDTTAHVEWAGAFSGVRVACTGRVTDEPIVVDPIDLGSYLVGVRVETTLRLDFWA
jgi:hypothetical protein